MPILPDDHAMTAASVAGSAASAITNRSTDTFKRKVAEGLCGALVGVFWGPAIADAAGAVAEATRVACAFATGAGGLILLTGVLDGMKGVSFRDWLGRFIGPKLPPG